MITASKILVNKQTNDYINRSRIALLSGEFVAENLFSLLQKMRFHFILFIFSLLLFVITPTTHAQNNQPRFYAYNNCIVIKSKKDKTDLLKHLLKRIHKAEEYFFSNPNEKIDIPLQIAKEWITPVPKEELFVFKDSECIGKTQVVKTYMWYNAIHDWELIFEVEPYKNQKYFGRDHPIFLSTGESTDIKNIVNMNRNNIKFLKANRLSINDFAIIRKSINKKILNIPNQIPEGQEYLLYYLPQDWKEKYIVGFSLKIPKADIMIVVFNPKGQDFHGFIACRTKKEIRAYSNINLNFRNESSFDQIIILNEKYYLSFYNEEAGGYGKTIYAVTKNGLKKMGEGFVNYD
jgi:hypothetical protein